MFEFLFCKKRKGKTLREITPEIKNRRYAYVIVACAFLTVFLGDYSTYQLPPISHLVIPELGINEADFSRIFTSSMIPGVLFCLVAGLLCDKFGQKLCIGIAIVISGIGMVGRIFATDFTSMFICMALMGVIATFITANAAKIVVNWAPPEKFAILVGVVLAGGPTAMTIAMATTALFPSSRAAFTATAILCAVIFTMWCIFMKNKPKEINQDNKSAEIIDIKEPPLFQGLASVAKNKQIWLVGICTGLVLSGAICTSTFLPRALQFEKGLDAVSAGGMTSFIMIGNIVGSIIGPVICYRIGKIRPFLFVACIIMAIGIAFSWKYAEGFLLGVCLFITGVACSAILSQLTSIPVLFEGVGPKLAGTAGGFIGTIRMLICLAVPSYVIAPIAGDNYTLLFILTGILPIIAAILNLRITDVFAKNKL